MARGRRGGPGWWRPVLVIVVPVVAATIAAIMVLSRVLDVASSGGRLDMIRTALAVGAGTGAVMTLVLGWRRQWSTEHDAAERRLTELYVKAVEQLGSDKAAVRHGALYALERVAQDNPEHRQTVVNVICAYLRAPYTPPPDTPMPRRLSGVRAPLRPAKARPATPPTTDHSLTADGQDTQQEREVRLTAQRILRDHLRARPHTSSSWIPRARRLAQRLRRPARTFWAGIDLDLTGATLINLDLAHCTARTASFTSATFTGYANFRSTTFTSYANFRSTTFTSYANFRSTRFTGNANFESATFTSDANFGSTRFTGYADFESATFTSDADFGSTRFIGYANFGSTRFTGYANFRSTTFTGYANFRSTRFTSSANFESTRFTSSANFESTTFTSNANFESTTLPGTPYAGLHTPAPWTNVTGAQFKRGVPPELVRFVLPPTNGGEPAGT